MTLPPVHTILFDVGNTLHHLDHEYIANALRRRGLEVDEHAVARAEYRAKAAIDEQIRAARRGTDASRQRPYYDTIMDALAVAPELRGDLLEELRRENQRHTLWRVMRDDTPEVLRALVRRGFTLGVVSNADGRVPASLAATGIADCFRAVIDSHLVGVEKPDPRIFALALEQCGATAAETVYVGDIYEIDVQGARGAGITPILLDPLSAYGDVDCLRIDRLARLLDLLSRPGS